MVWECQREAPCWDGSSPHHCRSCSSYLFPPSPHMRTSVAWCRRTRTHPRSCRTMCPASSIEQTWDSNIAILTTEKVRSASNFTQRHNDLAVASISKGLMRNVESVDSWQFFYMSTQKYFFKKLRVLTVDSFFIWVRKNIFSKSWECWQLTVFFTRVRKYIFTKVDSVESLDEYR